MSGRERLNDRRDDGALAAALRALPESTPQPDLWPDLARALQQRRSPQHWRFAVPAAIAAAIAVALLLPKSPTHDTEVPATSQVVVSTSPVSPPPVSPDPAALDANELMQLRTRSSSLERWIAAVAARAPQDGRDLMAAVEVEDLIGLVDVQLGGSRGDADALPLWRQRVALLEDLATIRGNGFALAENGVGGADVPAALDRLN